MNRRVMGCLPGVVYAGVVSVTAAGADPAVLRHSPPVPDAVIDLRTTAGSEMVGATWRYHDAAVITTPFKEAGPDRKASGKPNATNDLSPKAGALEFDDSAWPVIMPESLEDRRGGGKFCVGWYRTSVTIPARIGETDTAGGTVVFECVADDYAEVWIDGRLPIQIGQAGGHMIGGFNSPQRVVLTRNARPGQKFSIAVLVANGPLSDPPSNYIWFRSVTLDFYKPGRFDSARQVPVEIVRHDAALDSVVPPGARLEKLADGFGFGEGPVWVNDALSMNSYLLFSDPNQNVIHRWSPDDGVSVFRTKSGYAGTDIGIYHQPGSNGLVVDEEGRLTICEHGNRRVTRIEKNGTVTVLADRYEGKRLNSPNDLAYRSDGALYFTDPPFGLPKGYEDPGRELSISGVYCLKDGTLRLVSSDLAGPNGIAFSPNERFLYVANWDTSRKIVKRYDVMPDGGLSGGTVFFDMTGAPGEEALDGVKVDAAGNLFVSGPGGVWVISAAGKHLGMIRGSELPANMAWGDADWRTLYMTARSGLYRMKMVNEGAGWARCDNAELGTRNSEPRPHSRP